MTGFICSYTFDLTDIILKIFNIVWILNNSLKIRRLSEARMRNFEI